MTRTRKAVAAAAGSVERPSDDADSAPAVGMYLDAVGSHAEWPPSSPESAASSRNDVKKKLFLLLSYQKLEICW